MGNKASQLYCIAYCGWSTFDEFKGEPLWLTGTDDGLI